MTGWLLLLTLLILGGVLSTLGDRLGSRVGKARLSLFGLRPRQTAVVITVLTGSLISVLSLGLMLLVSRQLRVGLFALNELQARLRSSRTASLNSSPPAIADAVLQAGGAECLAGDATGQRPPNPPRTTDPEQAELPASTRTSASANYEFE